MKGLTALASVSTLLFVFNLCGSYCQIKKRSHQTHKNALLVLHHFIRHKYTIKWLGGKLWFGFPVATWSSSGEQAVSFKKVNLLELLLTGNVTSWLHSSECTWLEMEIHCVVRFKLGQRDGRSSFVIECVNQVVYTVVSLVYIPGFSWWKASALHCLEQNCKTAV